MREVEVCQPIFSLEDRDTLESSHGGMEHLGVFGALLGRAINDGGVGDSVHFKIEGISSFLNHNNLTTVNNL
jgi:hypothetical protein